MQQTIRGLVPECEEMMDMHQHTENSGYLPPVQSIGIERSVQSIDD